MKRKSSDDKNFSKKEKVQKGLSQDDLENSQAAQTQEESRWWSELRVLNLRAKQLDVDEMHFRHGMRKAWLPKILWVSAIAVASLLALIILDACLETVVINPGVLSSLVLAVMFPVGLCLLSLIRYLFPSGSLMSLPSKVGDTGGEGTR